MRVIAFHEKAHRNQSKISSPFYTVILPIRVGLAVATKISNSLSSARVRKRPLWSACPHRLCHWPPSEARI